MYVRLGEIGPLDLRRWKWYNVQKMVFSHECRDWHTAGELSKHASVLLPILLVLFEIPHKRVLACML